MLLFCFQEEDGIQAVEAFFLALDEVNKEGILPNITLGAIIGDSCDDESRVLEQAVSIAHTISRTRPKQDKSARNSNDLVFPAMNAT